MRPDGKWRDQKIKTAFFLFFPLPRLPFIFSQLSSRCKTVEKQSPSHFLPVRFYRLIKSPSCDGAYSHTYNHSEEETIPSSGEASHLWPSTPSLAHFWPLNSSREALRRVEVSSTGGLRWQPGVASWLLPSLYSFMSFMSYRFATFFKPDGTLALPLRDLRCVHKAHVVRHSSSFSSVHTTGVQAQCSVGHLRCGSVQRQTLQLHALKRCSFYLRKII